jgi:AraC-like DNA-binding protein
VQAPAFTIGLVQAVRNPLPRRVGRWYGPFRWPTWVIDWCGYGGQRTSVIAPGGFDLGTSERPERSWQIYAPRVAYRHLDTQPTPGGSWDSLWFFFQLRQPWAPLQGRPLSLLVDPDEQLVPHLQAMYALQQGGAAGHAVALQGHAQVVLGQLLLASQGPGDGGPERPWRLPARGDRGASLWHRVEREVLRDLAHPPTIGALAERLAMSPSSLSHRFRAETGMALMQRVRWLRLREARRLLAQPGASVKEVAAALGFSSAFHLSTLFRQHSGMTAQDYIARQRQ